MVATRPLVRLRHPCQPQCLRNFSSTPTVHKLKLAYDLYEPPQGSEAKNAPIVFIHGLFGSKKNNRSMSKFVLSSLTTTYGPY